MDFETLRTQLLDFRASSRESIQINFELGRQERSQVHDMAKELGLFSSSHNHPQSTIKYIIVSKFKESDDDNIKIDDKLINTFVSWASVPIPVQLPEYLDYYLYLTDKYYNSKKLFALFMEDVKRFGGINKFIAHMNDVTDNIIRNIKSQPQYKTLLDAKFSKNISQSQEDKGNFYKMNNSGKWFISVDIKSANFTTLHMNYPGLFDGSSTWLEYLSKETTSEFIIASKFIREVIFGKLGTSNRVSALCVAFISEIIDKIKGTVFYKYLDIANRSHDEVIFSFKSDDDSSEQIFDLLKNFLLESWPDKLHIKMFKLVNLSDKPYFVKEYPDGTIEFKKCPGKFIMQCIRFFQKEPCQELDLKFVDEGYVATYDRSIFNE